MQVLVQARARARVSPPQDCRRRCPTGHQVIRACVTQLEVRPAFNLEACQSVYHSPGFDRDWVPRGPELSGEPASLRRESLARGTGTVTRSRASDSDSHGDRHTAQPPCESHGDSGSGPITQTLIDLSRVRPAPQLNLKDSE